MQTGSSAARPGHYARKQIGSASRAIAWTHRRRFETGIALARLLGGSRVLDYGCGDGTLIEMLMAGRDRPRLAVGVERTPALVLECRERLAYLPDTRFVTVDDLRAPEHAHAYDAVFCMEVLEHLIQPGAVIDDLSRLLAPAGRLLVSVPVETGLPLLVKQGGRRVAGWCRIGDYPGTGSYSAAELARSVLPGFRRPVSRPVHRNSDGSLFHDHKGFDWRTVALALGRRFALDRVFSSPFQWLPPGLGMQVWFVASSDSASGQDDS
jgi:SAM-dependent methyltransferase